MESEFATSCMKTRISHITRIVVMLLAMLAASQQVAADGSRSRMAVGDSLTLRIGSPIWGELNPSGKMAQSAYPVKLAVKGNSLRVSSKHRQILPIYTQGGSLYLAMHLAPGVNWLNGLPRGQYRINNRTISIL